MTSPMPTVISMDEDNWTSLVHSVERGNCILMLGPDAVTVQFEGEDVPVLSGLARFVRDRLGPQYASLDPAKPASIAQMAVDQQDPAILQAWVREFHEQVVYTSSVFEDLAALPFRIVINTTPVLGIEEAFLDRKPDTVVDFYDRTGPARPNPPDPTERAPLIYNLYGSLEQPDSLILSVDDRLDFLVSVITDTPPVPSKVTSALRDDRRSFLFVGFSLHQWRLRLLLHVLASTGRRRSKSFAVEIERSQLDPETCLFYDRGHRIGFVDTSLAEFTTELRRRVRTEDDAAAPAAGSDDPGPGAPTVFICHASEDKSVAEQLAEGLRANGIRPWLDKDDLRGGDQWDQVIRRAIRNEVQYVVIVQSRSLLDKDVGYVNREIRLALDRQAEYRAHRRFVIPVTIDGPGAMLAELEDFHTIDVASPHGIDSLVRTINRDLDLARRTL